MADRLGAVEEEVRRTLCAQARPAVLAVSGGADSMALLHAAARVARRRIGVVASFDHATGPAATRAQRLVARAAADLGLPAVLGRSAASGESRGRAPDEASLRQERWGFLRDVARRCGGVIATGHTADDQLETVVMRAMRGAGARGLAALEAPAPGIVRPLLHLSRADVREWARGARIRWTEDPANASRRYFRNRVRHDLLPAMLAVRPSLGDELLSLARRAAEWRADVERFVHEQVSMHHAAGGALHVAAPDLAGYDSTMLAVLWPALAAQVGLALDRRGTVRLAEFTIHAASGAAMQLSGGWEVRRGRDEFELRRSRPSEAAPEALLRAGPGGALRWGRWHFRTGEPVPEGGTGGRAPSPWVARLPADAELTVRAWRPGDRLLLHGGRRRRVKRFLAEAGVEAYAREGWPVVLAGEDVIWIPGVRRSDAATERSGRPGVLYHCDVDDR